MKLFGSCLALAVVLFAFPVFAQNPPYRPPDARTYAAPDGAPLGTAASNRALAVTGFLAARGNSIAANTLVETATTEAMNNVTVTRFEERAGSVAIFGVYAKASFNARGELIHLIENLVPVNGAVIPGNATAAQALAAALQEHHPGAVATPQAARAQGNTVVFARTPFFHKEPTATRVAIAGAGGALQSGMLVETWSQVGNLLHETLVGPSGEVLFSELRTNNDSYNVFAVDPSQSIQAGWAAAPAG